MEPPAVGLRYSVRSDIGLVRESAVDSGYAGAHLLAVAAGREVFPGGEVASAETIGTLRLLDTDIPPHQILDALEYQVQAANDNLRVRKERDPSLRGAATTLTAMLVQGTTIGLVHIGDSRAYLLRDGMLYQITQDHTLVERLVEEGHIGIEEAAVHPRRDELLRVLNGETVVEPDLSLREAWIGDRYLLCTPGLSRIVSAETIYETLAAHSDPKSAIRQLIDLANRGGGWHNITCIVADLVELGPTEPPPNHQVLAGAVLSASAALERSAWPSDPRPEAQPAARADDGLRPSPARGEVPDAAPIPPRRLLPSVRGWLEGLSGRRAEQVPSGPLSIKGFEVLEPIGRGGFATVYRARQLSLNRFVAIKVLRERLEGDQLRRFEREVDSALRLSGHRNVVAVYDRGELSDGRPYLIMEFCERGSLGDRLKTAGPLPAGEVLTIAVKAADALAAAHREGILHRDLKPDNLLVTRFEPVALADFGIAKVVEPGQDASTTVRALTPAFAPPEMFDSDYAGPSEAGDLYSLGATLYALLAGLPPRHPGRELSSFALMAHYVQARHLPIPDIHGTPPDLMAAIQRALGPRPESRYRTAEEFLATLQRVRL